MKLSLQGIFLVASLFSFSIFASHADSFEPRSEDPERIPPQNLPVPAAPIAKVYDDNCSFEALTKDCTMFSPEGREMIDGKIPNFSAMLSKTAVAQAAAKTDHENFARINKLAAQQDEILELLEKPKKDNKEPVIGRMMRTFILSQALGELRSVFTEEKPPSDNTYHVAWPLDATKPEIKSVPVDQVKKAFEEVLGKDGMAEMKKLILTMSEKPAEVMSADRKKYLTVSPKRREEVQRLVDFSRKEIINVIRDGKAEKDLTEAQKNAIKKIEEIRQTKFDDPRLTQSKTCDEPLPNAFYNSMGNSINICENVYNLPDESVVQVVAHEMTHAIDPCNAQFGTFKVNKDKFKALFREGVPTADAVKTMDHARLLSLANLLAEKDEMTAFSFPIAVHPDAFKYFTEDKKVFIASAKPTPFADYLFKKQFACLASEKGGAFRPQDDAHIKETAKQVAAHFKIKAREQNFPYDAEKDMKHIVAAYKSHPECLGGNSHSQMGEAMADLVAGKVSGKFIKGKTYTTDAQRLAPLAFFANIACLERQGEKAPPNPESESISDTLDRAAETVQKVNDAHPESKRRIEEIFLRDPQTREALGCTKKGKEPCI